MTWLRVTHAGSAYFNSHAHVERDALAHKVSGAIVNFNSHAHVERDFLSSSTSSRKRISTHTLTWSVTTITLWLDVATRISTHTLTWSVTVDSMNDDPNPVISTHTLTWSVTAKRHAIKIIITFQLTRSRGA